MKSSYAELLETARLLIHRDRGRRGRLPDARIRRSISTSYYALFHFLTEEVGKRIVGTQDRLRRRRRVLARALDHRPTKVALRRVSGAMADPIVAELLRSTGSAPTGVAVPRFVQKLARVFGDAQAKRHDADYDLNKPLSETDARLLIVAVADAVGEWRRATTDADRDFKQALCILLLLQGKLRSDGG